MYCKGSNDVSIMVLGALHNMVTGTSHACKEDVGN